MVLNGEDRGIPVSDAFHGAVIEVEVRDLQLLGARNAAGIALDRKPVVLRRDKYLPRLDIPYRVITAAMSVGHFRGAPSEGEPQKLMS